VIEGYIGRPGSGKSYTLTERALREADRGRTVFTNYDLVHPNVWRFTEDQLLDLPPGVIVIDEAHLWFPARQALNLPPSWLAMLSQTRKAGWDLLWCAQHETRVDRAIRDVSSWQHLCTSWFTHDGHPMFFRTETWEPEDFRKAGKRVGSRWRTFNPKVAAAYDTYERLSIAAHTQKRDDRYANKSATFKATYGSKAA
jgi:zonular occludens toxin Zot